MQAPKYEDMLTSAASICLPRILIADDDAHVRAALRVLLGTNGYQLTEADSPRAVLSAVQQSHFDAALVDLNYTRDTTSGREGLDLLPRLKQADPALPVIVLTAWGSTTIIVEAMQRGAKDFLEKPWNNDRLLSIVRTQVELARAVRRRDLLEQARGPQDEPCPPLITHSPAMQGVMAIVQRIAPSDVPVLITGENGTGKSLLARILHAASLRAPRPLITVNVGGLADALFEAELFGHVKGAFTGALSDRIGRCELADGGTLFLDEIANISPSLQVKLLRVVETGEFERLGSSRTLRTDARLIAATNADLRQLVSQGAFRQDLFYRLNTVEISLPPLRQRLDDVPLLARHFLRQHAHQYRKAVTQFMPEAIQAMIRYHWPGNVRELDHVVERAVLMVDGDSIRAPDLGLQPGSQSPPSLDAMSLAEVEVYLIRRTLAQFRGNVSQAAEALGLSRSAMYRRIGKHTL